MAVRCVCSLVSCSEKSKMFSYDLQLFTQRPWKTTSKKAISFVALNGVELRYKCTLNAFLPFFIKLNISFSYQSLSHTLPTTTMPPTKENVSPLRIEAEREKPTTITTNHATNPVVSNQSESNKKDMTQRENIIISFLFQLTRQIFSPLFSLAT